MTWPLRAVAWLFGEYPLALGPVLFMALIAGHFWFGPDTRLKITAKFMSSALRHLRKSQADEFYVGDTEWIGGVRWHFYDGGFHRVFSFYNTTREARLDLDPASNFLYSIFAVVACVYATSLLSIVQPNSPTDGLVTFAVAGFVVAYDVLYQCGVQWILYPRVLDPSPISIRRDQVYAQKALGRSHSNSEEEARASLTGRANRKSQVYDQEY